MMRCLYILYSDEVEDNRWVDLLRPFTSVQSLYLSHDILPYIAPTMDWIVEEGTMEVLPSLQNIFLEKGPPGPNEEAIKQFFCRHTPLQSPYSSFTVVQ